MTSMHLTRVLPFGVLLALVFVAGTAWPATAQEVPFRLVHQGNLLPEGTAVVVLEEAVSPDAPGRIQPRFIDLDDYPRDAGAVSFRDTLNAEGRTDATFPRTQTARVLYFIYARTPDDTIYWSYSAQEDQLKFDVVATGAMSVAPATEEATDELLRLFFEPEEAPPVADSESADEPEDSADPSTDEALPSPEAPDAAEEATPDEVEDTADAAAETPAPSEAPAPSEPTTLTLVLAVLCGLLLLALFLLYRRHRALKNGVSDVDVLQAELAAAKEQLQEYRHLKAEHHALKDKYDTVRQHCDTLLQQHDRLREQMQDAPGTTPEAPKSPSS